jgi:hypothetical protein
MLPSMNMTHFNWDEHRDDEMLEKLSRKGCSIGRQDGTSS